MTQRQVADVIGVNQSTYNRWENGERVSSESIDKLDHLAKFYGVRPSRFFYDPEMDMAQAQQTSTPKISQKELLQKLKDLIAQAE